MAIDPVTTLLLAIDGGARTLAMAQCVVHQVVQVFAPAGVPVFLTAGFKAYLTALRTHVGHRGQAERRQATGPMPKPRWMPLPQLLSARVIQVTRRRCLVEVTHRVVFGTKAAGGRRVMTRCNGEAGLRPQLALSHGDDNFCVPHASLRQPLPPPEATKGPGSAKPWRPPQAV